MAGAAASNRQAKKQASLMATASVGCLRNAAKEDTRRLSLGKDSLKHAKGVRCCSAYHANIHKSPGAVSPTVKSRVFLFLAIFLYTSLVVAIGVT